MEKVLKRATDYKAWGVSELIEKCENAEVFAKEVAGYLTEIEVHEERLKMSVYLLEKARKLGGLKIK